MFRLKSIVPSDVLHTSYNSLIMPHFHYCLLTWGSTIRNGHKLYLLQKKALRLVDNSHYIAHATPYLTRCTRGVRVVFSVTRMRSSNSARMNKFDLTTEKIGSVHMTVFTNIFAKKLHVA